MNVSYRGIKQELPAKIQGKLDSKFAKLSKLLEKRGEREAHVIVDQEKRGLRAEITIQFYDHQLVAEGRDADLFTALLIALEKLETQAVKQRGKWREKHRREAPPVAKAAPAIKAAPAKSAAPAAVNGRVSNGGSKAPRVFRVRPEPRKPITLDEAVILMEKPLDYLVYRDAASERMNVLVRRRDGGFDLIES